MLWTPLPDTDGDGLADQFEAGFVDGIAIVNEETRNTATVTGSAADGATITSGSVAVDLPANTSASTGGIAIAVEAQGKLIQITGSDLPAGATKSVTMAIDETAESPVVCIEDTNSATIESVLSGGCSGTGKVQVPIPNLGEGPNIEGGFTVSRLSTVLVKVDGLHHTALATIDDADADGIQDRIDACPSTPGLPERQGCPVGDANNVTLHTVDQRTTKTACPGGAGSCKVPVQGAEIRVFDREQLAGLTITVDGADVTLPGNPNGGLYPAIYEQVPAVEPGALVGGCTTDAAGYCLAGEEAVGEYLVIVKHAVPGVGTVYTGKPKGPGDFVDTNQDDLPDLATKDFQILQVFKKSGSIEIGGGSKTVLTGSYLEIISPDYTIWEEGVTNYVYPFIFTSDSDWDVDVCAEVPQGYEIAGVYDVHGNLVPAEECVQTVVANETKVIAFEVTDLQSPKPHMKAKLTIKHKGKTHKVDLNTPGHRQGKDNPGGKGQGDRPRGAIPAGLALGAIAVAGGAAHFGRPRRRSR